MQSTRFFRALPSWRCFLGRREPSLRSLSTLSRLSRPLPQTPLRLAPSSRYNSSLAVPESEAAKATPRPSEPSYHLTFTCKPCKHRSTHVVTKHGYHKGTVLIKCPSCSSRHVISDHLKIFMDEKSTLEDILSKKGDLSKLLKKGRLGMRQGELIGREGDEDIEFWDDGTQTEHKPTHIS